jgi:PKD repeat protein
VREVTAAGGITTIAGTGLSGFAGDGGQATSAQLVGPQAVAVDRQGTVYIADYDDNRIRKVSAAGTITTVAGTGTPGYNGDGIRATSAQLHQPVGVAVDRDGSLYIADQNNNRVRKVLPDGTIVTLAGTGLKGFSGDGGPATLAKLDHPAALAVDERGNVYVADTDNHRVRKVSVDGTITTLAGTGVAGSSGDGGPARSAQLNVPLGVAVDGKGDVYIGDTENNRIRKVSNLPPRVSFTATPMSGVAPLAVSFAISDSGDPDGILIEDPVWRFGDGATAVGATTTHTYTAPGQFTVSVTVRDDAGATTTERRTITVSAPPSPPQAASPLKLTLGGARSQRLLAKKGITVTAGCDNACSLAATGRVRILGTGSVFKLTPASATLAQAGQRTLELRISSPGQNRIRRLLTPSRRARATITVRAADSAGHTSTSTRSVDVRR